MTYFVGAQQTSGPLELTVIEHFTEMDQVHVHSKRSIDLVNLAHPRLLAKHLVASSEVLKNRAHRLFYVLPPFGTIIPLDDIFSLDVFFVWFRRNVHNVYAVVLNRTTSDFEKVVKLHVGQMYLIDTEQAEDFRRTVAKPFSHRPMKPEVDLPENQLHGQNSTSRSALDASTASLVATFKKQGNTTSRKDQKHRKQQ